MAKIGLDPLYMKDVDITFSDAAADDYGAHVSGVVFTPTAQTSTFTGMSPGAVFTEQSPATWTCGLTYAQDWKAPKSLGRYLHENEGKKVTATFRPTSGAGPSFTAAVILAPGAIGGASGSHATSTVTLGSDKPKLVPAT